AASAQGLAGDRPGTGPVAKPKPELLAHESHLTASRGRRARRPGRLRETAPVAVSIPVPVAIAEDGQLHRGAVRHAVARCRALVDDQAEPPVVVVRLDLEAEGLKLPPGRP